MSESFSYDDHPKRYKSSVDGNRLEQKIELKRVFTSSYNPKDFETISNAGISRLYEHVLVVGAPPDESDSNDSKDHNEDKADKQVQDDNQFSDDADNDQMDSSSNSQDLPTIQPRILFLAPAYPLLLREAEFDQVVQFCFPTGLQPHKMKYKRKKMLLTQFVFKLNGTESANIYGICCHFCANPRRIPFFATPKTLAYPFCFCILTRNPILSVHFQYLTYLVLLYNRVVNPDKASRPSEGELVAVEASGPSLSYLQVENNTARWPNTRFPQLFANELLFFGTIKSIPNRDKRVPLTQKNSHANLNLWVPHSQPENIYIAMSSLDVLFSHLKVKEIVKLYTAMLLEHSVIFHSKKLHDLTMAVLAAKAILTPFTVESTFLPIVPNNPENLSILGSPIPYILGLPSFSTAGSALCTVDLDAKTVTDQELHHISVPNHKSLISKLKDAIKEFEDTILTPPMTITKKGETYQNPKFYDFIDQISPFVRPSYYLRHHPSKYVFNPPLVEKILSIFAMHFAPKLEVRIKPFFVTDSTDLARPITVFNKDLFLESVDESEKAFYSLFIGTSTFEQYCGRKTDEMQVVKALMSDNHIQLKHK